MACVFSSAGVTSGQYPPQKCKYFWRISDCRNNGCVYSRSDGCTQYPLKREAETSLSAFCNKKIAKILKYKYKPNILLNVFILLFLQHQGYKVYNHDCLGEDQGVFRGQTLVGCEQ